MTAPNLTAWDTVGRAFLRTLLREPIHPATLDDMRTVMDRERVRFTLDDVADEIGVRLPAPQVQAAAPRRPRPRRKVRG